MRIVIADDEAIARRRLARMLERVSDVVVVGDAEDGMRALQAVELLAPDVVLLDIEMPAIDGLEVARLCPRTMVIFTTAHESHALQAFALNAVDYLLKPVSQSRLEVALERAARRIATLWEPLPGSSPWLLKAQHGRTIRSIDPRVLSRIYMEDKLACCDLGGRQYHLRESLSSLEGQLEEVGFIRCHRKQLVNTAAIVGFKGVGGSQCALLTDGTEVPVSRRRLATLRAALQEQGQIGIIPK